MPNLAAVFKTEITRLARKELRAELDGVRKTIVSQRTDIAALKRQVSDLERAVKAQGRSTRAATAKAPVDPAESRALRFSAGGLASLRQKLGLSAADLALLVGTTGQSIYAWEQGRSTPRAKNLAAIAALRGVGKRAVIARLSELRSA